MSDQRELSLRLNGILDMVGASEKMRKFHHRVSRLMEIAKSFASSRRDAQMIYYNCGSSYEGTFTPELISDVDQIYSKRGILVVADRQMAGPGFFLHIIRDDWTRPGYAKLQLVEDGRPITMYDLEASNEVGLDVEGRVCVKHFMGGTMHGPARKLFDENGTHIQDNVPAFQCKGIPIFAVDWITRQRRYGWPPQQLLDELKMMGSLFVGIGYFNSPEKDLEWRMSFSLQERRLVMSLNPSQYKVFILLKMIKKDILEKCLLEETLSSYHCKTCVLYMAETTPARIWVPENLISCLLQSLTLLLQWVRSRFCPSFFLTDSNLFGKEGFSRYAGPLERLIGLILQTGHTFLYLLQSDCVGEILRHENLSLHRPFSNLRVYTYITLAMIGWTGDIISACRTIPRMSYAEQDLLSVYMRELEDYGKGKCVSGYSQAESQFALRFIMPWLHLSIGLEFAALVVTCPDRHEGKELMKKVDYHMQHARNTDFVNVKLAQATILLRMEKLDECFLMLQELENSWTFRIVAECPATNQSFLVKQPHQQRLKLYAMRDTPKRKLASKCVASCIIFERSQVELAPPPLRWEMYRSLYTRSRKWNDDWFDRAEVDANVYLYLLQYVVCSKLKRVPYRRVAMDNLSSLINHDGGYTLAHKVTACNLLGWVYIQEDRVADALRCFKKSWEIRPHHNAAKFHVLEMLSRMTRQ